MFLHQMARFRWRARPIEGPAHELAHAFSTNARRVGWAMRSRRSERSHGIFGVAMTLLILDVRLPDDFHPQDGGELLQGLLDLWPKFLPYVLSFGVLGPALAGQYRGPHARRIRQPRIRQLVAALSVADHLRAVHDHRGRPLRAFRAGDLALCRPYAADRRWSACGWSRSRRIWSRATICVTGSCRRCC